MELTLQQKRELIGKGSIMEVISAIRRLERQKDRPEKITRSNVAQAAGVAAPTVGRALDPFHGGGSGLIELGAVEEDERGLSINKKFAFFLGIHVGASKIRISICDFALESLNAAQLYEDWGIGQDTFNVTPEERVRLELGEDRCISVQYQDPRQPSRYDIAEVINRVIRGLLETKIPLISICICTPAIIDYENDRFAFCPNIASLPGVYIYDLIYKDTYDEAFARGEVPICFEHDTEAALVHQREMLYRLARRPDRREWGYDNVALVFQGSGTGAAFILNRKLHRGRGGASGEVGNLRAPFIPKRFRYDPEKFKRFPKLDDKGNEVYDSSGNPIYEDNLLKEDIELAAGSELLTIEDAIRSHVFNAKHGDLQGFLKKINALSKDKDGNEQYKLKTFKDDMRNRYDLFLQYMSYIANVLVDLLSMDVIIFGGAVFDRLGDETANELSRMKHEGTVQCLARDANIVPSDVPSCEDMVAAGAAIVAFYNCHENNRINVSYYSGQRRPICIEWPEEN